MINNPLDDIVKCNIDISSPASNDATFDSILLVVKGPETTGEKTMSRTTAISQADELLDYGFTTEDAAYIAATVAFSQNPAPSSLYICIRKETSEEEVSEPVYEDIQITLARAKGEASFYGIHLTEFGDDADVQGVVSWVEANEKIFGFEYADIEKCPVKNFSYYRSFGMFSGKAHGYEDGSLSVGNEYAALAWMAKCFGYQPGSETWAFKTLATIVPSVLSADDKKELEKNNISTFLRYSGKNVTIGGKVLAGEWIDVIRFRDWLKSEIQTNVFNAIQANTKTPYTDGGIGMVEGALLETLSKGQEVGGIAPTEYDEEDNEVPGYKVAMPRVASLTEADRKSRKLPGVKWSARLAGAIHFVEISGNLTF